MARRNGAAADPLLRDRLGRAWIGLQVVREQVLSMLVSTDQPAPAGDSVVKLLWSRWHRDLGELAVDVLGLIANHALGLPRQARS
jgi:alkylation response protein AidB-like acyl-CoA dehydrogenase